MFLIQQKSKIYEVKRAIKTNHAKKNLLLIYPLQRLGHRNFDITCQFYQHSWLSFDLSSFSFKIRAFYLIFSRKI